MHIFELTILGITLAPTYYGTGYAMGFLWGYAIIWRRGIVPRLKIDDLLAYVFAGVFLGGRLGYALFYNLPYYLSHPLEILMPWKGGMSYHGGVIGVILCMWIYAKRNKESFLRTADEVTYVLPIGVGLGRIGNYVNGELYGYAPYSGPLPMMVEGVAHFPAPLLEAFLEGPLLFLLLYLTDERGVPPGVVASVYVTAYAAFRIFAEFFRLPDAHVGYLAFGVVTLGQILSSIMLTAGAFLLFKFLRRPSKGV